MVDAKIQLMLKRIKQKDAAKAAGVSRQFISECTLGKRKLPLKRARRIERKFGIPISSWYTKAA